MTTKIDLKHPVTVDGQTYTSLTMRRAKLRDQRLAAKQKSDVDSEITLFANLCEVPPNVLDELDMVDYAQLQEVYRGFFGSTTQA